VKATTVVTAEQAAFRYPGKASAVGPFDLQVKPGELHLLCGASGCGKSTLARMLCGTIPHLYRGRMDGRVIVGGHRSEDTPLWQLSTQVGLVSQNPAAQLLASSVRDEIVFGLENLGLDRDEIDDRVETALGEFGLHKLAERDPRTLSGGEQQKLIVAAVAARKPSTLVLDEPLSMLDSASAARLVGALDRLRSEGSAVVAFEHREGGFSRLDNVSRHRLSEPASDDEPLPELPTQVPAFCLSADRVGVELGGRPVLRDVDLSFAGGQVWALIGANGSGKTTLLRTLAGLQRHSGRIDGHLSGSSTRPRLGLCFQNPDRQIFNPTVRQEILFGCPNPDHAFYDRVVTLLGLAAYQDTPPLLLSEGEKKRLALAILLMRPGLSGVCLDEPTLGQDERHRRLLGGVVRRLASAGYLCVIATHDLQWAAEWADDVLLLRGGRVVGTPSSESVIQRPELWPQAGLLLPEAAVSSCPAQSLSR